MEIRKARREDRENVMGLLGQFPPQEDATPDWQAMGEAFLRLVDDPQRCSIIVAEEGGAILGVITLSYPEAIRCHGRYSCIEEFIVAAEGRGKGIGGRLLDAALEEARSRGCHELQVNNPSEAGYPLYLRQGLKDIGKHLKIILEAKG